MTGKVNEPIYYDKMSDELIRYSRINSFIFKPEAYLSFNMINYNLKDDEVILIQSLLTQEYFETLTPASLNKYSKNISYDEAEPQMSQTYDNVIPSLDQAINKSTQTKCSKVIKKHITSSLWKKCFPPNYKEIEYANTNVCTFSIMIDLIEKKTGEKVSINKIKNVLYDEYKAYLEKYFEQIVDILIIEGKKTLGDQVKVGILTFANFIYTDNYFLTTLDLWLLVNKYEIPTIFICQKMIFQTDYTKNIFVGYGSQEDNFAFIVLPSVRSENIPKNRLIITNSNDYFIGIDKIKEECNEKIVDEIRNKITFEDYLKNFVKPKKTNISQKKKKLLIIEDEDTEEIVPVNKENLIDKNIVNENEDNKNNKTKKKNVVLKGNKTNTKKNKKEIIVLDNSEEEEEKIN
jgi:hypothetical protein